jgi:hypothetical protein
MRYGKCSKGPEPLHVLPSPEYAPVEMRHFLMKNIILQQ